MENKPNPIKYVPHLLILITFFMLIVSILSYILTLESSESIVSSSRLLVESLIIFIIAKYRLIKFNTFICIIVGISVANSLVIIIQVFESLGYIRSDFNSIIDFWGVRNELMRKPGFINSILTGSYVVFFGLVLNLIYKPHYFKYFVIVQVVSLFFSARTFMMPVFVILPVFLFMNVSMSSFLKFVFCMLILALLLEFISDDILDSLLLHFYERVVPAFDVILGLDLNEDYSTKDLMTHYRVPTFPEFIFGNGYPRYSELGGRDPTYTRWILQSGVINLVLVFIINCTILASSFYKMKLLNIALGFVLFLSAFKGELTTATILYTFTFLYFILGSKCGFKA